jgi:hypothetical protein
MGAIVLALREVLIREAVADVAGKVLAFRIGGQEVAILLRGEIEVAIDFAAMEAQVERTPSRNVCG